jgi:pyruvate, water dikinase
MAALSREFRVPTIVNTGDATKRLVQGQEVTVVAADQGACVYPGRMIQLVTRDADDPLRMGNLYEFRKKRYLLRFIAPLNLVDPLREAFTPEACRTLHDVLRFMHEKSMTGLIDGTGAGAASRGAVKLDLTIPAGITVIDIGGGLENPAGGDRVTPEQIRSVPFQAVVKGMTHPGLWRSEAVPLSTGDFLSSMLHAPDIVSESVRTTDINVAVISREYVNVSLKFGYHYAVLDSYVSNTARNNHIYFRFAGGATDITKRSLRLHFIARVLEECGFSSDTRGDLIIARLVNIGPEEMESILERMGRLLSYTRQMDAILQDERSVAAHVEQFLDRAS